MKITKSIPIVLVLVSGATASGTPIIQTYGGQITNICAFVSGNCVQQPDAFPPFSLDMEWDLSLTYETETVGTIVNNTTSYQNALTEITLEIAGLSIGGFPTMNEILIFNYNVPGSLTAWSWHLYVLWWHREFC